MTVAYRPDDGNLASALEALPLFPLPNSVFFPHTLLPLHVFEPRYRQLTEDVLSGHKHLGVVALDPSRDDAAVPGVARVAGVGRIVHHEKLADGRFHILLQGLGRAELVRELPMKDGSGDCLYRRAASVLLPPTDPAGNPLLDEDDDQAMREVHTLRSCYARLLEVCPDAKEVLGDLPLRVQEPRVVADVVCAAVLEDPAQRQAALEETCVARRLMIANDALATMLLQGLATENGGMH